MQASSVMKRVILLSGSLVAVVLCAFAYFLFAPDDIVYRDEIKRGNRLVLEIQEYRHGNGHLPASIEELPVGHTDDRRLYYERCAEGHFIVWFGTTLGESMTYDSRKRTWDSMNGSCGNR
jgi:hypothetical protein